MLVQTYPYGEFSIGVVDFYEQYIPFLRHFRENFLNEPSSFFYSWGVGMGDNLYGLYSYYLSSPLNFILYLFPLANIELGILTLILVKYTLIGFSASLFLEKYKISNVANALLSISYAFCGYATAYVMNIMWLDALYLLPILYLGIDRIIKNKRPLLFIVTYALMILTNFYIAYMTGLLSVIYFVYVYLLDNKWNWKHFMKRFTLFSLSAGISALINLPLIATTLHSLSNSKGTVGTLNYDTAYKNPLDIFSKLVVGSNGGDQIATGLPNIYVPSLIVAMVILYFFIKTISKQEKWLTAGSLVLYWGILTLPVTNYVLHGFNFPIWFQFRYSFVISFFFIMIAAKALEQINHLRLKRLNIGIILATFIGFCVYYLSKELDYVYWFSIVATAIYFTINMNLLRVFSKGVKPRLKLILTVSLIFVFLIESTHNVIMTSFNTYTYSKRYFYEASQVLIPEIKTLNKHLNGETYSRTETTLTTSRNDNIQTGLRGISGFNSTMNNKPVRFLESLGHITSDVGNMSMKYSGGTLFTDSLLNIKHIISTEDLTMKEPEEGVYRIDDIKNKPFIEKYTTYLKSNLSDYDTFYEDGKGIRIYENTHAIGYGWLQDTLSDYDFNSDNIYENMNEVYRNVFQTEDNLYDTVEYSLTQENMYFDADKGEYIVEDTDEVAKLVLTFDNPEQKDIYTNSQSISYTKEPSNTTPLVDNRVQIYANGVRYDSDFTREPVSLKINSDRLRGNVLEYVVQPYSNISEFEHKTMLYTSDDTALKEQLNTIKDTLKIETMENTFVKGKVYSEEDTNLVISIPYDTYWQVTVNGEDVEINMAYGSLISIPIAKGDNVVELNFQVPYLTSMLAVSSVSLLTAIGYDYFRKRK